MALGIQDLELQYRFYGRGEPALDAHLATLLNWYTAMKDDKDCREMLNLYFKEHKRFDDIETLKRVPDVWMPRTSAFMAHLDLRGRSMSSSEKARFEQYVQRALKHAVAPKEEEQDSPSVQDRMNEKVASIVAEIEGLIDDGVVNKNWSFYTFARGQEIGGRLAAKIAEAFQNKKTEDKIIQKIYGQLVCDALKFVSASGQKRKPRKTKTKTTEVVLRNFVFLKECPEFSLHSIDASKVIGAKELWTFNPKYKLLSVYRAKDASGLGVDYTKITNYDEDRSGVKTIGRKTEETVREILDSAVMRSKKVFEELKGKSQPVTRVTKDMLLLKVY